MPVSLAVILYTSGICYAGGKKDQLEVNTNVFHQAVIFNLAWLISLQKSCCVSSLLNRCGGKTLSLFKDVKNFANYGPESLYIECVHLSNILIKA